MSQNIEIKAYYPDLNAGQQKAKTLQANLLGTDHQVDTYFNVPEGRLKLRESSLSGNMLIPYLRGDQTAAKDSDYILLPVSDVKTTKRLLEKMLGTRLVVEKVRTIFLWQDVRIHLDRVKQLGNFLEFEAMVDEQHPAEVCREQVAFLLKHFEISETNLIAESYADLLERQSGQTQ